MTVSQGQSYEPLSRDSINIALAHGARAVEMLVLTEKIIENQKAVIVSYAGLANAKDLKVEVLTKAITRIESRTWWQKIWAWLRGAIIGAAITYIATNVN